MSGGTTTIKAHVKTVDMSEEMEKFAIDTATEALMNCMKEKDMAAKVRLRIAAAPLLSTRVSRVRRATLRSPVHPVSRRPRPPPPLQIKSEFDKTYNPTWHVIVGSNYGSHVVHSTKCERASEKWQRPRPCGPHMQPTHARVVHRLPRRLAVHEAAPVAS